MKDSGRVRADPDSHEHETELADGGIGQHFLDVSLGDSGGGGYERSGQPHPGQQIQHPAVGYGQQRIDPHQQIDACGHHRGGVNEGGHGRGAGHSIWQPHIQRKLRRLSCRSQHQQKHDGRGGGGGHNRSVGEDVGVAERAERAESQEDGHHEAEIADTVGDESLLACRGVGFVGEPEGYEEIRASPHAFPAEESQQQIVAEHENQHGKHEQVEIEEEFGEVRIAVHVAEGIEMYERAHPGDEQGHSDRKRVGQERHIHRQVARRHPRKQGESHRPFFAFQSQQPDEHEHRCCERSCCGCGC